MAERRMFAKAVVNSDAFLDLPQSSQNLYFHLGIHGDDDGFIDSPRRVMRMLGASEDDLKLLIAKQFLIPFENGVVVVRHWKIHNYIRNDRYKPTQYQKEMALLSENNGTYDVRLTVGIPSDTPSVDGWSQSGGITEQRLIEVNRGKQNRNLLSEAETAPDLTKAVITLTLNDKTEYPIVQENIDKWVSLYPAVDVMQELRNMAGWLDSNPSKRKTKSGILRFCNNWLSRQQNQGGTKTVPKGKVWKSLDHEPEQPGWGDIFDQ